jgi:hypothetical protein
MSVSSLALWSCWRDYWGMWNPAVEPYLAPLELSQCHAPRWAVLPQVAQQTIPASGKIQYNFRLQPGSIIWGMFVDNNLNFDGTITIQLHDVALGHDFFQSPISTDQLQVNEAGLDFPCFTPMLPYPVVGDGLFSFEMWGPAGNVFVMLLGVAEVTDCQVR